MARTILRESQGRLDLLAKHELRCTPIIFVGPRARPTIMSLNEARAAQNPPNKQEPNAVFAAFLFQENKRSMPPSKHRQE